MTVCARTARKYLGLMLGALLAACSEQWRDEAGDGELLPVALAVYLDDAAAELEISRVRKDSGPFAGVGMTHVTLRQMRAGLPIFNATTTVHLNPDLTVSSVTGGTVPTPAAATAPVLSEAEALALATAALPPAQAPAHPGDNEARSVELGLYIPALFGGDGPPRTAYRVVTRGVETLVDALTGALLLQRDRVLPSRQRQTFDSPVSTGTAALVEDTILCPSDVDAQACAVHTYVGQAYDYFATQFARDGWDDLGSPLYAYARSVSSLCSGTERVAAFANGWSLHICDGKARLDIVAHEFGHNVTSAEVNWPYTGEYAALHEGLADIWAVMIDTSDWLIGDGVARSVASTQHYEELAASGWSNPYDGGAVLAHAAYLLAQDVATLRNTIRVEPIGRDKVARLLYYTLTTRLDTSFGIYDTAVALAQACRDVAASAQPFVSSDDCVQVNNALTATGALGTLKISTPARLYYSGSGAAYPAVTCSGIPVTSTCAPANVSFPAFAAIANDRVEGELPVTRWHSANDGTYANGVVGLGLPLASREVYITATFSNGFSATAVSTVSVVTPIGATEQMNAAGTAAWTLPMTCTPAAADPSTLSCWVAATYGGAVTLTANALQGTNATYAWHFEPTGSTAVVAIGTGTAVTWDGLLDAVPTCDSRLGDVVLQVLSGNDPIAEQRLTLYGEATGCATGQDDVTTGSDADGATDPLEPITQPNTNDETDSATSDAAQRHGCAATGGEPLALAWIVFWMWSRRRLPHHRAGPRANQAFWRHP